MRTEDGGWRDGNEKRKERDERRKGEKEEEVGNVNKGKKSPETME
jgi:hypothetical protein